MAREIQKKATTYLKVSSEGKLYASSKEPRDGYVEFTSKQGNVSYRKYFAGTDHGHITQLGIDEVRFDSGTVRYLKIVVESEDSRDVIQLPLTKQSGALSDIVKRFTLLLPNVDFSKELTITSNGTKDEKGYTSRVMFVSYTSNGEVQRPSVKFAYSLAKDSTDFPGLEIKEGIDGIKYDSTKQDKAVYELLLEQLERFQNEKGGSSSDDNDDEGHEETEKPTSKETKSTPKKDAPVAVEEEDVDSDLPF